MRPDSKYRWQSRRQRGVSLSGACAARTMAGPLPVVPLGTARVHALAEATCVDIIIEELACDRGGSVLTLNLDILRRYRKAPACATLYDQASLVVADGKPILWACRILGSPLPQRITGSSLIWSLSAAAARNGKSVFFLGGNPGMAQKTAEVLKGRIADLQIAGVLCPEVQSLDNPGEISALLQSVSKAAPGIIFVAMGSPKQERLIRHLREAHPSAWCIGIGICFSFLGGDIRRAPRWMQWAGLEWLHRLAQEPERLYKRYLVQGIPFGITFLGEALLRRVARKTDDHDFRSTGS